LHVVFHLLTVVANEVSDVVALGAALDAEVAVLEDFPQSRRPLGGGRDIVAELPVLGVGHDFLPCRSRATIFIPRRRAVEGARRGRPAWRLYRTPAKCAAPPSIVTTVPAMCEAR